MPLTEPERFQHRRDRLEPGRSLGTRKSAFLAGALLIGLGALIALVVGMFAGTISPGQLVGLPTVVESSPASVPPQTPSVEAASPVPAVAPPPPATQKARVIRDEAFGDWRFVCVEAGEAAAASCSAIQQLRVAETGAAVFVWRIMQDGHGGLVGVWQVPETVLRAAGLTLDAGTPQPVGIPFETCGGGSCQAIANLTPAFIEKLSSAQTLSASVILTNQQTLTFPVSPTGQSLGVNGELMGLPDRVGM